LTERLCTHPQTPRGGTFRAIPLEFLSHATARYMQQYSDRQDAVGLDGSAVAAT